MSARSEVRQYEATRPGNGSSRTWSRELGGSRYRFTAVLMPSGERRYFVSRYNGYPDDRFACAWSRCAEWIIPPAV